MDLKCAECGEPFSRKPTYRFQRLTLVMASALVLFLVVAALGLTSGNGASSLTLIGGYGSIFAGLSTLAFFGLYRVEKRRNTLCPGCVRKAEKADQQKKLTWR